VKDTIDLEMDDEQVIRWVTREGVKETKESVLESSEQIDHQVTNCEITENINDAIENGVKETHHVDVMKFFDKKMENTLQNGVKETKTPGKDGDLLGFLHFMSDNNTDSVPELIDDVIDNGVKEIYDDIYHHKSRIEGVLKKGNKL